MLSNFFELVNGFLLEKVLIPFSHICMAIFINLPILLIENFIPALITSAVLGVALGLLKKKTPRN